MAILITADWKQDESPTVGQMVARVGQAGDWFGTEPGVVHHSKEPLEFGKIASYNADFARVEIAPWIPDRVVESDLVESVVTVESVAE